MKIMLSAGEASGDRLGGGLARELRRLQPDVELLGMGGEKMAEAGVRVVQDASEVAVVGIVEVLARLRTIRRAMGRLRETLRKEKPDLLVPIDFPDFNLRLAAYARRVGVPVVYMVSPQVWAWRRGRVRAMRPILRRMLVLFPFESAIYETEDVPVTFVGHPLVEPAGPAPDRGRLAEEFGLDPAARWIALLPGSRTSEIDRLLRPMIDAARRLGERFHDLQFVLPRASTLQRNRIRALLDDSGAKRVVITEGSYPEILRACAAGVVASGTASLESALAELPIVVVYRVQPLTYLLGRALVRIDHIALPNLVAERRVVPELIQRECTGERIAREIARYLEDPAWTEGVRAGLREVRSRLGVPGALERAARAVLEEAGAVLTS